MFDDAADRTDKSSSPRGSFHANGAQNAARASLRQRKQRGKLFRATHFVVLHNVILFKLILACYFRSKFLHCFIVRRIIAILHCRDCNFWLSFTPIVVAAQSVWTHGTVCSSGHRNQNAMQPPAFQLAIVDCNVIFFFYFPLAANIHKLCVVGRATAAHNGA